MAKGVLTLSQEPNKNHTGDGLPSPVSPLRRWLRFIIAVLMLFGLLYSAPALERLPVLGEKIAALRESGINVGAWYYDDVEEYFEAEDYIKKQMNDRSRRGTVNKDF